MLAFAYYLLKMIICSAVLFGYYWFFLRNKVFHAYNRFYLLAIIVVSVGLPVIKFNIFHETANKTTVVKMLQVVTAGDEYMDEIIIGAPTKSHLSFVDILPFLYAIISIVFLIMLAQMLISIFYLLKKNEKINIENVCFINTDAARGTPFSFFKYIFWNKQIDLNSPSGNRIFKHEIAHVQQRHSWDKMFINIILIVFWSNPVFWLIRKELSMIHEFIADKQAVEDGDTAAFAAMILHATYPQKNFYITNNFFYSPIKRRLMMLTKNQHPRMNYISRLLVLPLLVIVFGAFNIKIANNISKGNDTQKLDHKIVVVLDAGHGGTDFGGVNKDGITEKDIALQLVKKIEALNKDGNIQIILTRDNDVFSDPKQKATFAKAQNPDLFISVHIDNNPKEKWNTVSGMSVVVANNEIVNTDRSKILASAIIGSFKNNYELNVPSLPMQRKAGIWILKANDFPSVLIEAGYLSNDKDLAYLQSEKGQNAFAKNVLDAINKYAAANLNALNSEKNILPPSDSSIYYRGKKVKSYVVSVNTKEKKITSVKLLFYDSTTKIITAKEAYLIGVEIPPVSNEGNLAAKEIPLYLSDSIRRKNESVNLIMKVTKDSADMVYLLNGKKISQIEGSKILSTSKNDIQVYDEKAAFKTFGIKTKNGLINILTKNETQLIDKVFTQVEMEAKFPGGEYEWGSFLRKNLNANIASDEGFKPGTYKFVFKFIVAEDGSLSDFSTENYSDSKTAKHCIEVLKNGPKWIPAKQNGHIVAAYRKQPITFVISDEMDEKEKVISQLRQSNLNKQTRGAKSLEY